MCFETGVWARTMESVLESRVTVASAFELSVVQIGYWKRTVVTRRERNENRVHLWLGGSF